MDWLIPSELIATMFLRKETCKSQITILAWRARMTTRDVLQMRAFGIICFIRDGIVISDYWLHVLCHCSFVLRSLV